MDNLKNNLIYLLQTTQAAHPLDLLGEVMQHFTPFFDLSPIEDGQITLRLKDEAITDHAQHIAKQAGVI